MSDQPFNFDTCDSPATCREGLTRLLAAGQDWSEIHCGRCNQQGIVRHADLLVAARAAANPALSEIPAIAAPAEVVEDAAPAADNPADDSTDSVAESEGKGSRK